LFASKQVDCVEVYLPKSIEFLSERSQVLREKKRLGQGFEEHARIAEALIQGDPQEAERMIRTHLGSGKAILLSPRGS
jgi:DNA-binding GntR family transcriptional regulator